MTKLSNFLIHDQFSKMTSGWINFRNKMKQLNSNRNSAMQVEHRFYNSPKIILFSMFSIVCSCVFDIFLNRWISCNIFPIMSQWVSSSSSTQQLRSITKEIWWLLCIDQKNQFLKCPFFKCFQCFLMFSKHKNIIFHLSSYQMIMVMKAHGQVAQVSIVR